MALWVPERYAYPCKRVPNKIEEVKGSFLPKLTSVLKDFSYYENSFMWNIAALGEAGWRDACVNVCCACEGVVLPIVS